MYTAVAAFGNGGGGGACAYHLQIQALRRGLRLERNVHSVR